MNSEILCSNKVVGKQVMTIHNTCPVMVTGGREVFSSSFLPEVSPVALGIMDIGIGRLG